MLALNTLPKKFDWLFNILSLVNYLGMILDVFGAVCITKGAKRLVVVVLCRTKVCKHQRLWIATERILQKSSKFRISVRDVRALAVDECRNNVSEGGERQVDLRRLFQTLTGGSSLALTFWSGQVDQVKFANSEMLLTVDALFWKYNKKICCMNIDRLKIIILL